MNGISDYDLMQRFTYHSPKEGQQERYEKIRELSRVLSQYIVTHSQVSREQSLAVTKIEEAVMWANAGIARNE